MNTLGVLIPIALAAGIIALVAFLWSVRSGQYEDLDGAAHRVLLDDEPDDDKVAGVGRDRQDKRQDSGNSQP